MNQPLELHVLDVGHGNSAIARSGDICAVIDAARGDPVGRHLELSGIRRIEYLILSHSDNDHVAGAARLLLDDEVEVGTAYYNADGLKDTKIWDRIQRAVSIRYRKDPGFTRRCIDIESRLELEFDGVRLEVLHPSVEYSGHGPTRHAVEGLGRLTSNSLSVVLRVLLDGDPVALLPADMDALAFTSILERQADIKARMLVFPHHGGLPGTSDVEAVRKFAAELVAAVEPEAVIFSIGSGTRPALNPRPEIVAGVREAAPMAHLACTQLSSHCHPEPGRVTGAHLSEHHAAGRERGRCCAGTLTISRSTDGVNYEPALAKHREFVASVPKTPLCLIPLTVPEQRDATSPAHDFERS